MIKVHVFKPKNRKSYQCNWKDPYTQRMRWRSAQTVSKREAERFAARLEKELRDGTYADPSKIRWDDFRIRYEEEVLAGLADKTDQKVSGIFNTLERVVDPVLLAQVDANAISRLVKHLRGQGRAEDTIKGYLAHLGAALRWAADMGLIPVVPKVKLPKRVKKSKVMKGRPATTEEFERMLAKVPNVLGMHAVESWQHYLTGMWWSGLRLAESLELYWDRDDKLCVDLSGKYPMMWIPAALEKGNRDRLLPIVPEFAEFLLETPKDRQRGRVFTPMAKRLGAPLPLAHRVGEIGSEIGRAAGVMVDKGRKKYASIHDFRRAFGERWAMRVMPQVLKELMRHESIETTLRYYVGRNAQSVADAVWSAAPVSKTISVCDRGALTNAATPSQVDDTTGFGK